jgi:hypothetical protein
MSNPEFITFLSSGVLITTVVGVVSLLMALLARLRANSSRHKERKIMLNTLAAVMATR